MKKVSYEPIGTIHSPFNDIKGMPIQPTGAEGIEGVLEIKPEFTEGLKDLDGFSHIILIYHFHKSENYSLTVEPFLDKKRRGVFSTRAPKRPNPIGFSIVRLIDVDGSRINIKDIDVLDGTPILDIKPYVPEFDHREVTSTGWLNKRAKEVNEKKSDDRFR